MNRVPIVTSVLNAGRTFRQLLGRRNAFEALAASDLPLAPGAARPGGAEAPLEPRDVSSTLLLLLAWRRARASLASAVRRGDHEQVEAGLAKCGSLLRMNTLFMGLGTLRMIAGQVCQRSMEKSYRRAIRDGLQSGVIVPGTTRGIASRELLAVRLDTGSKEVSFDKEMMAAENLNQLLQKRFAGYKSKRIPMNDEDLEGLPENLRQVWAGGARSYLPMQKAKYSVKVDRNTIIRIVPFVQRPETRRRVFETFFAQFSQGDVLEAALDLLRVRQQLAHKLGFESWAAYQLRPLATSTPDEARKLMDSCWNDVRRSMAPVLRKMEEVAGGPSAAKQGRAAGQPPAERLQHVKHVDEAFYRALVTRELDVVKLAEFLKATDALKGLLTIVGQAYGVRFNERFIDHWATGWRAGTSVFEVVDNGHNGRRLGFVYIQLEQARTLTSALSAMPPGAAFMCPGHCFVGMNFSPASRMAEKLLNYDEVTTLAHELGHAVHMLCQSGTTQEFDDQPLDLLELPSTLSETVAMNPTIMVQYARHHASGGAPPDGLAKSCQQAASRTIIRMLQGASVSLGLHSKEFDAMAATPQDLHRESVALWQRYSMVEADPSFTPFGEDAGLYLVMGASHAAYLLCNVRTDAILFGGQKVRPQEVARRWLNQDFASKLRTQLLERPCSGQRMATLLPVLADAAAAQGPLPHPLPPLPGGAEVAAGMVARKFGLAA